MLWLIYALLSAFTRSLGALSIRKVLREEKHQVIPYTILFVITSSLFFIPGIISEGFAFPIELTAWIIALTAMVLWFIINLTGLSSYKKTELSLRAPLNNSRVLIVFLLGIIFLAESVTIAKIIGVLLIFLGATVLTYHKGKIFGKLNDKGVQLTLLTALLTAVVAIIDKMAMGYFTVNSYGFIQFFFPGLALFPLMWYKKQSFKSLEGSKKIILFTAFFIFISYFFELHAYKLAEITFVYPVIRLTTLFSVLLGAVILKEKGEIKQRVIGTVIILLGVLFISLI